MVTAVLDPLVYLRKPESEQPTDAMGRQTLRVDPPVHRVFGYSQMSGYISDTDPRFLGSHGSTDLD